MPTAQPTLCPPSSSSLSPSSSPPRPYTSSSSSTYRFPPTSPTFSPSPAAPSSSLYTMDHPHRPHWQQGRPGDSHAPHSHHDRARKDPEASYHPDPYYGYANAGPRPQASPPPPSSHQDYYHRPQPPQQHHHRPNRSPQQQQRPYHQMQEDAGYRPGGEPYGRRGHRYSTDSAAADTLLMLSAAAFMDPAAPRAAMASEGGDKHTAAAPTDEHHYSSHSAPYRGSQPHTHAGDSHHQRRYSPALDEPRPPPMAKTISAPASSSSPHSREMQIEPRPAHLAGSALDHPGSKREPSPPPPRSSESAAAHPPAHISSAARSDPPPASASINRGSSGPFAQEHTELKEDEDEEDVVMSEGVVHVNARLAPVTRFPQSKLQSPDRAPHPFPPIPPSISTSALTLQQQQHDSPKTPTSARTPRTPKQTKAPKLPKTPRTPKRSQSDYQGSGGGRGKNGQRDSYGDYFYSPFPPSASPASSPSSPSSFQAQLQILTHNFVSIQPHTSPTNRFRRTLSSIVTTTATPPFSPPSSPGSELTRDSPFHLGGSTSAATSPTKGSGDVTAPTTPTSESFSRSGSKASTPLRSHFKPRWHTQPYMMFLALRAIPDRTAARQELIMAAVELDKKFSAEKGLPRVFTGKTPMNSASACLTNNGDKYFIPFKPEGSRSTHFRLAYQPGDFDTAAEEYGRWMEQLVQHDWPICFGVPKEGAVPMRSSGEGETKEFVKEEGEWPGIQRACSSPESRKRGPDIEEWGLEADSGNSKKVKAENEQVSMDEDENKAESVERGEECKVADGMQQLVLKAAPGSFVDSVSCPTTPAVAMALESQKALTRGYRLQDLDLDNVPTCLADIVLVNVSTVPNAGNGLFAKIDLPAGTPLGFYFGVPMTENEFDSLKDGVGMASQYSIMYRRTVLDATDEKGQPYMDPNGPMYCPFHFMNEDPDGNVSFITGSIVNQVICTTNRDVKAGEELFVFYGREMDRHWGATAGAFAVHGQGKEATPGGVEGRSRGGSRSRASSPVRRIPAEDNGRPRRETVYKPARYTR